ncbi:MAG: hypothetical protein MHPSP_004516, partial [Paramarteilia canceri]
KIEKSLLDKFDLVYESLKKSKSETIEKMTRMINQLQQINKVLAKDNELNNAGNTLIEFNDILFETSDEPIIDSFSNYEEELTDSLEIIKHLLTVI